MSPHAALGDAASVRPALPGRMWVVILLARPTGSGPELRELSRALRGHGARRVSGGVYLVPDAEGLGDRLAGIADRIRFAGGSVVVGESGVVESRGASG